MYAVVLEKLIGKIRFLKNRQGGNNKFLTYDELLEVCEEMLEEEKQAVLKNNAMLDHIKNYKTDDLTRDTLDSGC